MAGHGSDGPPQLRAGRGGQGGRLGHAVGDHAETLRGVACLHVAIQQGLAGGDQETHAGRQSGDDGPPFRHGAPVVVAAKTASAALASRAGIAEGTILAVEHVVGAEPPQIVQGVKHGDPLGLACGEGRQGGGRDVVDVQDVRLQAAQLPADSPVDPGVPDVRERVPVGLEEEAMDGDAVVLVPLVRGCCRPVGEDEDGAIVPPPQETLARVIHRDFRAASVARREGVPHKENAHSHSFFSPEASMDRSSRMAWASSASSRPTSWLPSTE